MKASSGESRSLPRPIDVTMVRASGPALIRVWVRVRVGVRVRVRVRARVRVRVRVSPP